MEVEVDGGSGEKKNRKSKRLIFFCTTRFQIRETSSKTYSADIIVPLSNFAGVVVVQKKEKIGENGGWRVDS